MDGARRGKLRKVCTHKRVQNEMVSWWVFWAAGAAKELLPKFAKRAEADLIVYFVENNARGKPFGGLRTNPSTGSG